MYTRGSEIHGTPQDDIFIYLVGDGGLIIHEPANAPYSENDQIRVFAYQKEEVKFENSSYAGGLLVTFTTNENDWIRIEDFFDSEYDINVPHKIENIVFDDGTGFDLTWLLSLDSLVF